MRNYLFNAWKKVAHRYGFLEWEGPTVEATELYLKKSGRRAAHPALPGFTDQGDRDITIRPELTSPPWDASQPPTSANTPNRSSGLKSAHASVMKNPQKGRLRDFTIQCSNT